MNGFVAVLIFFVVLQLLTASGRLYVRIAIVKKFGWDDVAVVMTVVFWVSQILVDPILTTASCSRQLSAPASLR